MWRIWMFGVALWLAMAAPAQGTSEAQTDAAGGGAVQGSAAVIGKAGMPGQAGLRSIQLQLGGVMAYVEPAVRARAVEAASDRQDLESGVPSSERHEGPVRFFKRDAEGSGGSVLSYAFTPRMSLGLRYRFLTDEDLAQFEAAESGSLSSDYLTHRFVVRARWAF